VGIVLGRDWDVVRFTQQIKTFEWRTPSMRLKPQRSSNCVCQKQVIMTQAVPSCTYDWTVPIHLNLQAFFLPVSTLEFEIPNSGPERLFTSKCADGLNQHNQSSHAMTPESTPDLLVVSETGAQYTVQYNPQMEMLLGMKMRMIMMMN